jgi:CheY-like chemotaxis protein
MIINKNTVFLVVDDFEPMRKVTSGQLRLMGANTIITANDGAEALRILQSKRVDIVLSDWNMPVMTGLELLIAVRTDERLAHLPFIMITAEAARERVKEAIASGVSELLVKPYTTDHLASRIEKAMTQRPRSITTRSATLAATHGTAALPTLPAPPTHPVKQVPPSILIVDDSPDNLLILSHLFMNEYSVRIAHTGEKALGICQSNEPPDLVLLDIMMSGGMDGFEVARRMREHPTSETIPVIFVTAMSGEEVRHKGFELGAVDFVTKPIDPDGLKQRVHNFLRYVELHKHLQADYDHMLETARLHEDAEHITRHDIKNPLAGLIGLVQELEGEMKNSKHAGQLRMIEETALQVLGMINLTEELLKIETGRFQLNAQPVKIGDILRRITEISRTTFTEKHLVISVDTDVPLGEEVPQVLGDATFCNSIFQNLIKNACEAAPQKSRVSITLMDETPLRIMIQNKGAVPAEIREHFFDKFVTHGKQGGTGLGTYSAKLLTEAQHGSISSEISDENNQTTIIVTLPRYLESAVSKALRLL